MAPVFENVGGILLLKTMALLDILLWIVNLNMVFEHHKKCGIFPDFHYGFRSSRSTLDLLTAGPDRIAGALDRSVS